MTGISSPVKKFPPRWEEFLKAFTNYLSKPSSSLPGVRCITEKSLSHVFEEIRINLHLPTTYPSGIKILNHLLSMGLAFEIPLDDETNPTPSHRFFLLGLEGLKESIIDPLELLQAYQPSGVICYFSALAHLSLTTQTATHHHVATLTKKGNQPQYRSIESHKVSSPSTEKPERSRLGSKAFEYQGISYFLTKRFTHSIPGIQTRILSPRTKIRITTLEQTLLDTLQFPFHCGGPETVFEVWEKQYFRLDEDVLLSYIKKIRIPPLLRRAGTMLDLFGRKPQKALSQYFDKSKKDLIASSEFNQISLLRGVEYSRQNSDWNVLIP